MNFEDILNSFNLSLNIQEIQFETNKISTCRKCNSDYMETEDGTICSNPKCGVLIKNNICQKPEWKMSDDHGQIEEGSRCGVPSNPLIPSVSLGCAVDRNYGSNKWTKEFQYVSNFTKWNSVPHLEKILYDDLQYFTFISNKYNINKKIISSAMYYHSEICKYGHQFRGNNREGLLAAALFIACKLNKCPRTIREISYMFEINIKHATTGCKNAIAILKSNKNITTYNDLDGSILQHEIIFRYASVLCFTDELCILSAFMTKKINQLKLFIDKMPESITAGVLYFISNKIIKKSKDKKDCQSSLTMRKEISQLVYISEATIGKCSKLIESIKEKIIPPCIIEKYKL